MHTSMVCSARPLCFSRIVVVGNKFNFYARNHVTEVFFMKHKKKFSLNFAENGYSTSRFLPNVPKERVNRAKDRSLCEHGNGAEVLH